MLHDLLIQRRDEILERCLRELHSRYPDRSRVELMERLPAFVDELVDRLRRDRAEPGAEAVRERCPDLVRVSYGLVPGRTFDIGNVVRDYALVMDVIGNFAIEHGQAPDAREFQLLAHHVDEAIASAVESCRAIERSLEARERAEYLGQLAHELRNAVSTALLGFELVQKGQAAVNSRTAEVVRRALRHGTQLINQTLAESRLSSGVAVERQRLDVAGLFSEVAAAAFPEREIALELDVAPDLQVVGDPRLLLSTLGNLVQNAIKFSADRQRVVMRGRAEGDCVNLEIEDRCGGLAEGVCERIFQPFVQQSSDLRGVGLGLSIARRAVEAHGGTIDVRNLPGVGCVFSVRLPNGG